MQSSKLGLIAASTCLLFSLACGHKDDGGTPDATTSAAATDQSTTAAPEPAPAPAASSRTATATLQGEDPSVTGTVTITEEAGGGVRIVADVSGAKDGQHGFHVHEPAATSTRRTWSTPARPPIPGTRATSAISKSPAARVISS
jgi:Cu/Zn superoxide dismutase